MSLSAKQESKRVELSRLPTVEELARDRFGDVEGLAIIQKTTLELAKHYAARFDLVSSDPEVSVIAAALAFARHKEFILLLELERDLFTRVATSPEGATYGETLFNVTRTGAYKEIHRELDRLHMRAGKYLDELRGLAAETE